MHIILHAIYNVFQYNLNYPVLSMSNILVSALVLRDAMLYADTRIYSDSIYT